MQLPRGVPRHKLEFLIGALQSGAVDSASGINMYQGFQDQMAAKRAAIAEAAGGGGEGLDALRSAAIDLTSGDTLVDPEDYIRRLQGIGATYGMSELPPQIVGGLDALYSSQAVTFDEDDKKEIAGRALVADKAMGRAAFREQVRYEYESKIGPEMYQRIKPEVDAWIDLAWDGRVPPDYLV